MRLKLSFIPARGMRMTHCGSAQDRSKGKKMIRNIKVLSVALVAILLMGAMTASSALAVEETQGVLTSDGSVKLTGTDTVGEPSILKFNGTQSIECHGHYDIGNVGETPHGAINLSAGNSVTTVTVLPTYSNCFGVVGATKAPATVTLNGCDYVIHMETTNGTAGQYGGSTDMVCPAGKQIEAHLYNNAEYKTSICTYTFGAQTGKKGSFGQNEAGGKITIGGTVTGIKVTRDASVLCGKEETVETATFKAHSILSGTNGAGGATAISISEKGV
jgi:hypothetical protein